MKIILSLLASMLIITACKNGWSVAERNDFVNTCANAAAPNMGQEKAKAYCSCMQQKLEAKYPNSKDANKAINAPGAMQTPEMTALVQNCLNGGNANTNNNNPLGNPGGILGGNNNNNANTGGAWSADDEQKFMNTCLQNAMNAGADQQTSNAHCNCTLKKIEAKYKSYSEAEQKMTPAEVNQMEQECNTNNNTVSNNNTGGGWTREQHQQFVQGCSTSAQQQQGMTAQQANAYCDCMTTKIEQKYTFEEANHLTPQDLQTPEWQQAMIDCGARRQQ